MFNADVGSWERGRVIRVKARTVAGAFKKAQKEAIRIYPNNPDRGVVQIRRGKNLSQGKTVWDSWNWDLIY